MGLKLDTRLAKKFVATYYEMLKLGTPFLSCFPEECVFTAIYGQGKYKRKWKPHGIQNFLIHEDHLEDTPKKVEIARGKGAFFIHLRH
jgi:hypothetical protein